MRIYAIDITADDVFLDYADTIEDIEDKDFKKMAMKHGNVWTLNGFINALNRSSIHGENIDTLWFRVIDSKENA